MSQRILSISGLRGVIGDGLEPGYLVEFATAFGTLVRGGAVVLSCDGRASGSLVKHAVLAGLQSVGCHVLDAGIASTPTAGVLVKHHAAAGGLQITASHNPIQWNGLKPFSAEGSVFDEATGHKLLSLLESKSAAFVSWDQIGTVSTLEDPSGPHLERVLRLIDSGVIQRRRFKVVLDCNHGSGGVLGPGLLHRLGCDVHVLGGKPDGQFEHVPEPLKENLGGLCETVQRLGADVGFAQDPDADRLAIVDNTGRFIGEELTLALCADFVLSRTPGPVVVNGSTSRVSADIAAKYGCPFYRSFVGEAHVVAKMRAVNAIIGGEGNGGLIEPQVGYVRDSFASMAYVLGGMAVRSDALSAWVDELPRYTIVKDKLTCPRERVAAACAALRKHYLAAAVSEGDGLRLDWNDRWVQVRASNTEPILRVIAEAPGADIAVELCAEAIALVRDAVAD